MRPNGDVDATISACRGQLAIGGHCLAAELNTWNGFRAWTEKVKMLPDYFLEGAIEASCTVGIPHGKKNTIYDFLRARRDEIETIVMNNKAAISKLPSLGP